MHPDSTELQLSCHVALSASVVPKPSSHCDLQALIEVQSLDSGASAEVHGQVWCHSTAANTLSLLR